VLGLSDEAKRDVHFFFFGYILVLCLFWKKSGKALVLLYMFYFDFGVEWSGVF
jgi:hypothetical protein